MRGEDRSQPPTVAEGSPAEPSDELAESAIRPGLALGRWTLVALIGEGGAGEVWEAVDEGTGETAALKVLTSQGRRAALRFNREIRLFRALNGHKAPALIDYEKDPTAWVRWLALEYIDWPDLGGRVKTSGRLVQPALGRFVIESWEAIVVLRQHGIVHRDWSARNLLVDRLGHTMLIDFGTGKDAVVDAVGPTTSLPHTFGFAAPEALVRLRSVGRAADIWGWGAAVFYAATGRHVIAPSEYMTVLDERFEADVSELPEELRPAVAVALRRNPDDRNEAEIHRLVMAIPGAATFVEDLIDFDEDEDFYEKADEPEDDDDVAQDRDAFDEWLDRCEDWIVRWFDPIAIAVGLIIVTAVAYGAFAADRDIWPFDGSPDVTEESVDGPTETTTTTTAEEVTTVPPAPPPVRVVSDHPQSHMAVYQGEQPGTTCALALTDLADSDPPGDITAKINATTQSTPVPTEAYADAYTVTAFSGTGSYIYNWTCAQTADVPTRWVWQTAFPGSNYLGNEVIDVDPPFDMLPSYEQYLADKASLHEGKDPAPLRERAVS